MIIDKTLDYEERLDDEYSIYGIPLEQINYNKLSKEEARNYYITNIYKRLGLNQIKDERLAWKIFDICVSQGIGTSARFVQRVLDIKEDGKFTKELIDKINNADADTLIEGLIKLQIERYIDIAMANRKQLLNLKILIKRALDNGNGK